MVLWAQSYQIGHEFGAYSIRFVVITSASTCGSRQSSGKMYVMQAQSHHAEQVKREKALEVKTIRSSSGCLEMANVQTIGENLTKKVQESKSACKLVEEALRAQMRRQIELEK